MKMFIRRVIIVLAVTVALPLPLLACPEETVHYPPFTVSEFGGRILPLDGEELLPGTKVTFILREKREEDAKTWEVPVQADGRFLLGLPDGQYEFTIKVEGFLFTLKGDVTIRRDADAASMEIPAPWC